MAIRQSKKIYIKVNIFTDKDPLKEQTTQIPQLRILTVIDIERENMKLNENNNLQENLFKYPICFV